MQTCLDNDLLLRSCRYEVRHGLAQGIGEEHADLGSPIWQSTEEKGITLPLRRFRTGEFGIVFGILWSVGVAVDVVDLERAVFLRVGTAPRRDGAIREPGSPLASVSSFSFSYAPPTVADHPMDFPGALEKVLT